MKTRTLLTCLALTGVLSLSSAAYASEVSVQSLINDDSQTEDTEASDTASQESGKTPSDGQIVSGTSMYEAGVIPFNTKISGTATAGAYNWYSFTTGSDAETEYKITCVNTSQGPGWDGIDFLIYDEYGDCIVSDEASTNGTPSTISTNELNANTTYYIRLSVGASNDYDYVLTVSDPTAPVPTESTDTQNASDTASQKSGEAPSDGQIVPGTSMYEAGVIPFNTKVSGTATEDAYNWYSFTTGSDAETEYKIICVNTSQGPEWASINFEVYDEYGDCIVSDKAYTSGTPSTISTSELNANTTYYIRLTADASFDYILTVSDPAAPVPTESTDTQNASDTASQKSGEAPSDGQIVPGTSMYEAGVIPFNTKVSGTATEDAYNWYSFTTGSDAETEYKIICVNTSQGPEWASINFEVYDEYGDCIVSDKAYTSGTPSTISTSELNANTTYYIRLTADASFDYVLTVQTP